MTSARAEVRLWIFSDLHMELTRGWDLPPPAERPSFDVLVVAGDLITRMERGVRWLRDRVQDRPVIYVSGNHEWYGADLDRTVEKAKEAAVNTNVFVLADDLIRLGGVTFAGCCLWTDYCLYGERRRAMAVAGDRMNDFKKIRVRNYTERFRPQHALARHLNSRAFLEAEMRKPRGDEKVVVVTHHAPIPDPADGQLDPAVRLGDEELLTASYRSDLRDLMWPQPAAQGKGPLHPPALWAFGHTHYSEDAVIGHTRVVSNPKGYGPWKIGDQWENPRFDPMLVLNI